MRGAAVMRVQELGPGELEMPVAGPERPISGEPGPATTVDRSLAADHPFLRCGTWRAFVAGDRRAWVRVVASLDPRQRVGAGRVGAIGYIITSADLGMPAVRQALCSGLEAAETWLGAAGAVVVRCPVQFSTWYGHRAMTAGFPQEGGPPRFPMEPGGAPGLGETLVAAGFTVAHQAASYLVAVDRWIGGARLGEERMRAAGFRERPVRLESLDDELRTLHAISMAAFRPSWGFSEIAFEEFASIYRPLAPLIDPDFVKIAEAPDGEPVGFIFAFPDPATGPGHPGARFIAKSVAVLPEVRRRAPGIGTGLAVAVHRSAEARGYRSAVHACVADDAYTQRVSARWGERFRSYATFERVLS